jgi:hypothetical protein
MHALNENIADELGPTREVGPSTFAALSLFAANAGMFFLYFALDLTLFEVVVVYWFEALWVGLFSGLKLVTASLFGSPYDNRWLEVSWGSSLFFSLFAIVKSTGVFLGILIFTGVALVVAHEELTGVTGDDFVREQGALLLKCSLLFFIGHALSFVINFLVRGEFRHARAGTLIWLPFKRSLALFVTIVAALTALQTWPGILTETTFALLLIIVKLAWDYFLHKRERYGFAASADTIDA